PSMIYTLSLHDALPIFNLIKSLPLIGPTIRQIGGRYRRSTFMGSQAFWEANYARGGDSGAGSYGEMADFKAEVLNRFVLEHNLQDRKSTRLNSSHVKIS